MSSISWCERAEYNANDEQQGKLTQQQFDHCSNRSEELADKDIECQSKLGHTTEAVPTLKDIISEQRCILADGPDVKMNDDSRKRTHDEATSPNKRNDDDATGSSCSTSNGDLDDRNRETMKDDGYMTKVVSNGDSGEAKKRKVQVEDGITLFRTTSIQMPATSSSNAAASTVHHAHEPAAAGIARPPLALTTSEATNDKQAVTHGLPLDLLAAPHTSFGSAKSLINATKGHIDAPRPLRKAPAFGNVRQSSPNTLSNANHAFDDTESDGKAALDKHQHDNDDKEHAGKEESEHDANADPVNGADVEEPLPKRIFSNLFSKVAMIGIMLVMALGYAHSKGALTNTISATGVNKGNVTNVLYEDESFY